MKKLLPLLLLAVCSIASAQDTIRVCTYNVLNYSVTNEDGRLAKFRRIFKEIQPDLVIVQEMVDEVAQGEFISAVDDDRYIFYMPMFHDGPDSDNTLIFNGNKFLSITTEYIQTSLRDIAHYTLYRIKKDTMGGPMQILDTLHIYSAHLKAGDTEADATQRTAEVQILKSALPPSSDANVIVAGDFNFYSSNEQGYQILTGSGPRMVDPLHSWEHSNINYVDLYTQSPRYVANAACGGGTGGGMDDRFDFIFHSEALGDNLINGSYTVFGNDAQDRRNTPINTPPNTKVSASIADDLFCASDHLPVYADFIFETPTSVIDKNLLQGISLQETSSTISLLLPAHATVTIIDILGRIVLKESVSEHWSFPKDRLQSGVYYLQVQNKEQLQQFKFFVAQ